jgi:hypothetical protein
MAENRELWAAYLRMRGWTVDEAARDRWCWRDPVDTRPAALWTISDAMHDQMMRDVDALIGAWMRERAGGVR